MKILQSSFYRPTMFSDSFEWVKLCEKCERMVTSIEEMKCLSKEYWLNKFFYVWGIYFMGPFPPSNRNLYILLAVDYVSK